MGKNDIYRRENPVGPFPFHPYIHTQSPPLLSSNTVAPRYAGGGGGVRALYICIQLYIDELSPANPLFPSIALASRT